MRLDQNGSVPEIIKEARTLLDAMISSHFRNMRDQMLQAEEEIIRVMEKTAPGKTARKLFHTERLWAAGMIAMLSQRQAEHWRRKALEIQETLDSLED